MPRQADPPRRRLDAVTAVHWILVPVTAFAVWLGTLLIGIGGSSLLDSWCPPDLMVSGACTAPWHRPAMAGLEMICAGTAAVGFIVLPAKVAPAYRSHVAVVCFASEDSSPSNWRLQGHCGCPPPLPQSPVSLPYARLYRGLRRRTLEAIPIARDKRLVARPNDPIVAKMPPCYRSAPA
jgi:hypothetical protein